MWDTYREDGYDDPHCTEHSVIDGLPSLQRVLDTLIIAVKPSLVRLDGARLNDEEGQAGWNHTYTGKAGKERRKYQCRQTEEQHLTPRIAPNHNMVMLIPFISSCLQPTKILCYMPLLSSFLLPISKGLPSSFLAQVLRGRLWKSQGIDFPPFHNTLLKIKASFVITTNVAPKLMAPFCLQGHLFLAPQLSLRSCCMR